MRRLLAPMIWLLLLVLHAPTEAQAVVFSLLPGFFAFKTTGPAMLFVTGAALLVLSHIGVSRRR